MLWRTTLPLLLLLNQEPAPIQFPDGPAAKAWAGVGVDTVPRALPKLLRAACSTTSPAGTSTATWQLWARWLAGEVRQPSPKLRAALCLLARAQGRDRDAWEHYAHLTADPRWVATVTPYLLPGAPLDSKIEPGGTLAPLPDKTLLQPCLPPPTESSGDAHAITWRKATARNIQVGEAIFDLTISVEATGVQVDLVHTGGGAGQVAILIPEPPGYEIRIEYLDWAQTEQARLPILVDLAPGQEPHTLWGRMIERRNSLPTGKARGLPRSLISGGLYLSLPGNDPQRIAVAELAPVLGDLLGVPVRLTEPGAPLPTWTGIVLQLGSPSERGERLTWLASAIESFILQPK